MGLRPYWDPAPFFPLFLGHSNPGPSPFFPPFSGAFQSGTHTLFVKKKLDTSPGAPRHPVPMCHAVNFVYTTAKAMDSPVKAMDSPVKAMDSPVKAMDSPVKAMDTSSVNFIDTSVNFMDTSSVNFIDTSVNFMDTSSVNFIDTSVPNPCRAQITSAGLAALIRLIGSHGLRLSRGVTANSQQIMAALGRRQQQTQSIFRRAESANLTLNREALR